MPETNMIDNVIIELEEMIKVLDMCYIEINRVGCINILEKTVIFLKNLKSVEQE